MGNGKLDYQHASQPWYKIDARPHSAKQGNPAFPTGIEGLRMQTVYYSLMRNAVAFVLLNLACCGFTATALLAQQPTAPASASHLAIQDSHEGMTVGVEPWLQPSRYKEKFPKKTPFSGGVVAIRLVFRNDTDESISIDLHRITLLLQIDDDNRQELSTLTADDVADAVLLKNNGKDPTARRNPLPIPINKPKPGRDKNWIEFKETCENAALPSPIVAAHSTVDGLVYFDIRSEWDLLQHARIYIPNLSAMGTSRQLSYFDIDLTAAAAH
jgi:hypothetical protein